MTTPRVGIPIAFALLLACAVPVSSAANHPDFVGRWLLNKDRSDALEDKDRGNPNPAAHALEDAPSAHPRAGTCTE